VASFDILKIIRVLRNPGGLRELELVQRNIAHLILLLCFWSNAIILFIEIGMRYWEVAQQTAIAQIFYLGMVWSSAKGYWRIAIWVPLLFCIHIAATGMDVVGYNSSLWVILILVFVIAQVVLGWRGLLTSIALTALAMYLLHGRGSGMMAGALFIKENGASLSVILSAASMLMIISIIFVFSRIHLAANRELERFIHEKDTAQAKLADWNVELNLEVERKTSELQIVLAKAQAANQIKSLFLANMSHEIRTPMNAVHSISEMLYANAQDSQQRELLQLVVHSSTHLMAVINDILDYSKIEAGKIEIESVPFDAITHFQDSVALMRPRAEEKGLNFEMEFINQPTNCLVGDPVRTDQIVLNLLSNAVKFTERGSVRLIVDFAYEKSWIQIRVVDTGIGIPAEKLGLLFTPFTQADASTTRQYGGTGLGLSICKTLAEAMGGTITYKAMEINGSTFEVLLPRKLSSQLIKNSDLSDSNVVTKFPKRILIVEDNAVNQKVIQLLLTSFGVQEIFCCENGLLAIEHLAQKTYDVVLMDCQMPVMDGFEATRQIRNNPLLKTLPVVALTANVMEDCIRKCKEVGMDGFISKPIQKKALQQILAQYA